MNADHVVLLLLEQEELTGGLTQKLDNLRFTGSYCNKNTLRRRSSGQYKLDSNSDPFNSLWATYLN